MYKLRAYVKVIATGVTGRVEQRNQSTGKYWVEFDRNLNSRQWFAESELAGSEQGVVFSRCHSAKLFHGAALGIALVLPERLWYPPVIPGLNRPLSTHSPSSYRDFSISRGSQKANDRELAFELMATSVVNSRSVIPDSYTDSKKKRRFLKHLRSVPQRDGDLFGSSALGASHPAIL